MALDSLAKRYAVKGVGRPWLRGPAPDASLGEVWRVSIGQAYPVATLEDPPEPGTPLKKTLSALGTKVGKRQPHISAVKG